MVRRRRRRTIMISMIMLPDIGLQDQFMMEVDWVQSKIRELDLSSTELSNECLLHVLTTMPGFTHLGLGYCEFFDDNVSTKTFSGEVSYIMLEFGTLYKHELNKCNNAIQAKCNGFTFESLQMCIDSPHCSHHHHHHH